jgi:hypothetical protein
VAGQNTCAPCAAGSYIEDDGVCTTCPTGYTSRGGVYGIANCERDCPVGFGVQDSLTGECTQCGDTGIGLGGLSPCSYCPPGQGAVGVTSCEPCKAGTAKAYDVGLCDPCTRGFASMAGAEFCYFEGCEPGYGLRTTSVDFIDVTECAPCAPGTAVQYQSGQPFCTACAAGSIPNA